MDFGVTSTFSHHQCQSHKCHWELQSRENFLKVGPINVNYIAMGDPKYSLANKGVHKFSNFNEEVIIQSQCKLFVISRGLKLCPVSSYTAYNCSLWNCTCHIIWIIYGCTSLSRRVVSCLGHFTWHRDHWISRYCCYYNTTNRDHYNTTTVFWCALHHTTWYFDSKVLFSNALHAVHKLNQTLQIVHSMFCPHPPLLHWRGKLLLGRW